MDILETRNLKKYYKTGNNGITVKALDGIDLSIKKGEFLSITGTSVVLAHKAKDSHHPGRKWNCTTSSLYCGLFALKHFSF